MLAPFFFLVVFLCYIHIIIHSAILPSSVYTQNIQFNGQPSTQQVMSFTCSDTNTQGTLLVGDYDVTITCNPPIIDYDITEINTIPTAVQLVENLVCLVTDETNFNQAIENANAQFLQQQQDTNDQIDALGGRRRLLAIERFGTERKPLLLAEGLSIAALAIASTALALGIKNSIDIKQLQNHFNELDDQTYLLTLQTLQLSGTVGGLQVENAKQGEQISDLNIALDNTTTTIQTQLTVQNQSLETIRKLAQGTQDGLNALQIQIQETQQQTQFYINSQNNITHQQILALADVLSSVTKKLQDEIDKTNIQLTTTIQNMNARDAAREDIQSDRVLIEGVTSMLFQSLARLDNALYAFWTDNGVKPGSLTGIDLRNTQEVVYVNFIAPLGDPNQYEIHNLRMKFYLDTEFGLQQQVEYGSNLLLLNTMVTYFSTDTCERAYVSPTQSPDAFNNVTCRFWVEVEDTYCTSDVTPRAYWSDLSKININASLCTVGAIQPTIYTVLKSFTAVQNYVAQQLCGKRGSDVNSKFMLYFVRRNVAGLFDPPRGSACNDPWDTMWQTALNTNQISLLHLILGGVNQAWQIANVDLSKKRLKRVGAIPGGIDLEVLPHFHLPIATNATTGDPIYDGSIAPKRCMQANWIANTKTTLPIYSKVPSNTPAVYKSISVVVKGHNNFTCEDASVCYPVGSSMITQDIIYQTDRVPSEKPTVFLGSLVPAVVQSQGMYDVPESQLECNPNDKGNENTLCYMSFPAGVRESWSLNQWIGYHGIRFEPEKASISASDYRFASVFDRDGFPMCSHGIAPGSLSNITVDIHGCNNPYIWNTSVVPSFSTISNQFPVECQQSNLQLLFQNFLDNTHRSFLSTTAGTWTITNTIPASFSFWFQSPLIVSTPGAGNEIVVLELKGTAAAQGGTKYLRYIVDTNGIPAIVISSSATANTGLTLDTRTIGQSGPILTPNLRDGVLHQIVWKSTVSNFNTGTGTVIYELYVDQMYMGIYTSNTGSYLRTDSGTFQYSESTLMVNEEHVNNADYIRLGIVNSNYNLVNSLIRSYSCQQAWFNKRCLQPTGLENLIIMRQNVTDNNNIFCDVDAQLVLSIQEFDTLFPKGVISANQLFVSATHWSIGFWIRLPPISPTAGQFVFLQNAHTTFKISLNGITELLDLLVNEIVVASINVQDKLSHNIYIVYNGVNVLTYLDAQLFGSAVAVSPASSSSSTSSITVTSGLNYVSMLKYYDGKALTANQVDSELHCQIDNSLAIGSFIPPIGYCEQSTTDPLHGYCRSPLLCAGHCSAYATIDNATRTFVVGSRNCDDGQQTPDCIKQCSQIDETTGRCVNTLALFRQSPVPLGSICEEAKNYQIYMNVAEKKLHEIGRQWLYSVTIQIPTGQVTSIIGSGGCPQIELQDFDESGQLLASFTNTDTLESNIKVLFGPTAYFDDPNNVECTSDCCNANSNGLLYSIPAGVTNSLVIPTCGNMTIMYSRLTAVTPVNTYSLCARLSGESLQLAIDSGNTRRSPVLLSTVNTVVNTAADRLWQIQQSIAVNQINLMLQQASDRNATDGELRLLLELKNQVINSTRLTYNTTFINFNLTGIVDEDLDRAKTQLAAAQKTLDAANTINAQIPVIQLVIDAISNNVTSTLQQVDDGLLGVLVRLQLLKITSSSSFGVEDFFSGVGNGIVDVGKAFTGFVAHTAEAVVDEGKSVLDKGLNSIFGGLGSIGGFFSELIKMCIYLAIIGGGAYAVYYLWKKHKAKQEQKQQYKKSDQKKQHESDEGATEATDEHTPMVTSHHQTNVNARFLYHNRGPTFRRR
jgi:hypothetical protein